MPRVSSGDSWRRQRFAHAVVIHLDARGGAAVSQEMVRTEDRDERPFVAGESGCLVDHFRRHRPAADGEHLQEPPRSIRRVLQAVLQHVGERRLPIAARRRARRRSAPAVPAETDCRPLRATSSSRSASVTARPAGISDAIDVARLVLRHRLERQSGVERRSGASCRSACRNGLDAISSVRRQANIRSGGGSGGRNRASSRSMLSASAQCRSSM